MSFENNFYQPQQPYYVNNGQRGIDYSGNSMQQNNLYRTNNTVMNSPTYLKGRPVVSIEEARAAQIDFDGSLFIFTDIGNKKIYTKQLNLDGTATLNIYELKGSEGAQRSQETKVETYATKEELQKEIENLKMLISSLVNKNIDVSQQQPPQENSQQGVPDNNNFIFH